MRISEAYGVLSIPAERTKYDRDTLRLHQTRDPAAGPAHRGSYSSTNPAGGRSPSGLSRRRSPFRGPPPSFHRNGGWGSQEQKRSAAHEESTGGGGARYTGGSRAYEGDKYESKFGYTTNTSGGMGPGQDPFGHQDDVPHFDREGHQRTGRNTEARQRARRAEAAAAGDYGRSSGDFSAEAERGVGGMFLVISGVILLSFLGPLTIKMMFGGSLPSFTSSPPLSSKPSQDRRAAVAAKKKREEEQLQLQQLQQQQQKQQEEEEEEQKLREERRRLEQQEGEQHEAELQEADSEARGGRSESKDEISESGDRGGSAGSGEIDEDTGRNNNNESRDPNENSENGGGGGGGGRRRRGGPGGEAAAAAAASTSARASPDS